LRGLYAQFSHGKNFLPFRPFISFFKSCRASSPPSCVVENRLEAVFLSLSELRFLCLNGTSPDLSVTELPVLRTLSLLNPTDLRILGQFLLPDARCVVGALPTSREDAFPDFLNCCCRTAVHDNFCNTRCFFRKRALGFSWSFATVAFPVHLSQSLCRSIASRSVTAFFAVQTPLRSGFRIGFDRNFHALHENHALPRQFPSLPFPCRFRVNPLP